MIIYFADRYMQLLGKASTELPEGAVLSRDEKSEDIDTGVASFSCYIHYSDADRLVTEDMCSAGNYLIRKHEGRTEFYTIIESEAETEARMVYVYAEDAGLDLLNEIADAYEATEAHTAAWYIEKWTADSGFEIGTNEIPDLTRTLKWESETTVTERLDSIATQFDNAEIDYSFDIEGMTITHKYINIYKSRGKDVGVQLRLGQHLNNITVKKSVANLATALRVTGGTPEGSEEKITLKGYSYDDGDFYVDSDGVLKSRKAVEKWTRYCWEKKISGYEGHIEKTYSYDTTDQKTLCSYAVTKLKSICDMEVNYEAEIVQMPANVQIGDRVTIIDDAGKLYVSARLLELKSSVTEGTHTATFGEYLIKESGISEQVEALASQFAQISKGRVPYTWIAYADDDKGTGISLDSAGKSYMGIAVNRMTEEADISDPSAYTWSKVIGADGEPGKNGDDGTSVTVISVQYQSGVSGVTAPTGAWSDEVVEAAEGEYLWTKTTFSDNSIIYSVAKQGIQGEKGDDAPTITSMVRQYYSSDSSTATSGGSWSADMPEIETGKYLWTRWQITWSTGNITYSDEAYDATFNGLQEDVKGTSDTAGSAITKITEAESNWEKQYDSLSASIDSTTKWMSDNAELLETVEKLTKVTVEDGAVKFNFDEMLTKITGNTETLETRNKYVHIEDDETEGATIVIGDSSSGMVAEFTKSALNFKSGDTVIASYANDGLSVENMTTRNQILFEGHGWAIRPGSEVSSGKFNLNDVWIGG